MSEQLQAVFDLLRQHSKTERKKGTYFERLVRVFLLNDANFYANEAVVNTAYPLKLFQ